MPWNALVLIALVVTFEVRPDVSVKPIDCDDPKPYRGPKLHAAPRPEVFRQAAGELSGSLEAPIVTRLEHAFEQARRATKAPAMTVAVGVPGKGLWSATQGDSLASPRWFWFASVGKAWTAAVVLQLVEEKKLSLDDRLAHWFSDYPDANGITIDHLLCHTSGIYSFQSDPAFRARRGYFTPAELIDIARSHENSFCPGEYWSYSNTGYVMLGQIIEQIEGKPFHEVVSDRLIRPLGLTDTKALAPREEPAGVAVPHPSNPTEAPNEKSIPTTPYAAGNIVASATDMVLFWHALLAGKILKTQTVRDQFARLYPMFDEGTYYGRGTMLYDVTGKNGRRLFWLGHGGGAPGAKALVAYSLDAGAYVAVALNNDGSAEATANLLLQALAEGP